MSQMLQEFRKARQVGAPLISINTPDPTSVIQELTAFYREARKGKEEQVNIVVWDIMRGVQPIDAESEEAAAAVNEDGPDPRPPAMVTGRPDEALARLYSRLPKDSIVFMINLHIALEDKDSDRLPIVQGVWNLRDAFKSNQRTFVMLQPDIKVPQELTNDVLSITVDLPDETVLGEIVAKQFKLAGKGEISKELKEKAVATVTGLSRFIAENVVAMSLTEGGSGFDLDNMWNRKRKVIETVGGLKVSKEHVRWDDIAGLASIKGLLKRVLKGKRKPRLVVLFDEIEKAGVGGNGSTTDTSGTDALGQLLSNMQDNDWSGVVLPGVSGTGKTETAKAMGTEADGLFIKFDFGGMKDMWVGNSEKMIRQAMSILKAMGGKDVFFVATTNNIDALPPELLGRFGYGIYFFDLPTKEERKPIWAIWMKKFNISDQQLPDDEGWVGRNIRDACKLADELGISLIEAAKSIAPVGRSMGKKLRALRLSANGKYLSASKEGFYVSPDKSASAPTGDERKINLN